MSIFNIALQNSSKKYITVEEANKLFYNKTVPNLVVNGTEYVQNEVVYNDQTVYGNMSIATLEASGSVTLGSSNSNHSISGALNISNIPRLTTLQIPTDDRDLATKAYVDGGGIQNLTNLLSSNNTWTGTNQFNTIPTVSSDATTSNQLTRKNYVDTAITTSTTNLKSGSNTWTGTNTFNTSLPTSSLDPSTSTHLARKNYVDNSINTSITNLKSASNNWTNTNTFNTSLPTSTLNPSLSTDLTTKLYVDQKVGAIASNPLTITTSNALSTTPSLTVGDNPNGKLCIIPNSAISSYNTIVPANSTVIFNTPNTGNQKLALTTHSTTTTGVLVEPNKTTIGAGGINLLPTSSIVFDGSFNTITLSQLPKLSSVITPSNDTDLSTKKYTDDAVSNLKTTANTWTNSNTFRGAIINDPNGNQCFTFDPSFNPVFTKNLTCTSNVSAGQFYSPNLPLIETDKSSTATSNNLVQKAYVDGAFNNLKNNPLTLQSDGTNAIVGLTINTTHGSGTHDGKNLSLADINTSTNKSASLGVFCNSDNNTSTIIASSSSGINTGVLQLCASSDSNTGITIDANNVQFNKVPTLSSDLTSTITNDLQIVNKKYVDTSVNNLNVNNFSRRVVKWTTSAFTTNVPSDSFPNYLTAPQLGNALGIRNETLTFYKNYRFYTKTSNLTNSTFGFSINLTKFYTFLPSVGTQNTTSQGGGLATATPNIKRTTAWSVSSYQGGTAFNMNGTHIVNIVNNEVKLNEVNSTVSNYSISGTTYTWRTGSNNYGQDSNFVVNYSITYRHLNVSAPVVDGDYTYFTLGIGFPAQMNSPCVKGWINSVGLNLTLNDNFDATGANGWYIIQANDTQS